MAEPRPALRATRVYSPGAVLVPARAYSESRLMTSSRLPASVHDGDDDETAHGQADGATSTSTQRGATPDRWPASVATQARPFVPTMLHYVSLLLSLRLLLRQPRWTSLLLVIVLLLTLEGRAKAERLGLRNTMGGVMGVVGVGLAWSTASEWWHAGGGGGGDAAPMPHSPHAAAKATRALVTGAVSCGGAWSPTRASSINVTLTASNEGRQHTNNVTVQSNPLTSCGDGERLVMLAQRWVDGEAGPDGKPVSAWDICGAARTTWGKSTDGRVGGAVDEIMVSIVSHMHGHLIPPAVPPSLSQSVHCP
ncbi:unnamed protein product [Parajaminaea phylloscopi]